jgi:hypothetical protein
MRTALLTVAIAAAILLALSKAQATFDCFEGTVTLIGNLQAE